MARNPATGFIHGPTAIFSACASAPARAAEVKNGELVVPDRPGWGADAVEEALLAHPPGKA
jgi:L-alanine-DL-glutamate epimerase-like enolase superfamily enzyme